MESNTNISKTKLKVIAVIAILFLLVILLSSCSFKKVAFTNDKSFSQDKLKKIQFYTSDEIVLIQTKQEGDVSVSDGKMVITNKKNVEAVIIRKGTPCVLEEIIGSNSMLFSFEQGDGRVLLFGNTGGGCFSLMAKEWNGKNGTLPYAGKTYNTNSGNVYLEIKVKNLRQLKGKVRTVGGRKL